VLECGRSGDRCESEGRVVRGVRVREEW
jgi:hypothetical protein